MKYELLGYFDNNVTYNGSLPASVTPASLVKGTFLTFQVNAVGLRANENITLTAQYGSNLLDTQTLTFGAPSLSYQEASTVGNLNTSHVITVTVVDDSGTFMNDSFNFTYSNNSV